MAVDPKAVAADKCYVTPFGEVRHVVSTTDHEVTYDSRGKKVEPLPWGSWRRKPLERFAQEVVQEVPWDHVARE